MTNQSNSAIAPVSFAFNSLAIRIITDETGEPWFLANDVCAVLGYANPRDAIAKHCRQGGVSKRDTPTECDVAIRDATSKARTSQEMTYINEGNLYRLIIKSRKPEAEPFETWVCDEVLPTIRKTGKYEQPEYGLKQLPEPKTKKALPGGLTLEQQDTIKALVKARAEDLPKDKQAGAIIKQWGAIKKKFGCTYKEVSPDNFVNIISLITRLPVEGELLPKEENTINTDLVEILTKRIKALEGELMPKEIKQLPRLTGKCFIKTKIQLDQDHLAEMLLEQGLMLVDAKEYTVVKRPQV
jgi:prophage antirepressor-like protein